MFVPENLMHLAKPRMLPKIYSYKPLFNPQTVHPVLCNWKFFILFSHFFLNYEKACMLISQWRWKPGTTPKKQPQCYTRLYWPTSHLYNKAFYIWVLSIMCDSAEVGCKIRITGKQWNYLNENWIINTFKELFVHLQKWNCRQGGSRQQVCTVFYQLITSFLLPTTCWEQ